MDQYDFEEIKEYAASLEVFASNVSETYNASCSGEEVEIPVEEGDFGELVTSDFRYKDDGDPRLKALADHLRKLGAELKALAVTYQDLATPEPEFDEDPSMY